MDNELIALTNKRLKKLKRISLMRSSFTKERGEACKQFNQIQGKKTKLSDLLLVVEMSKYISIVINKIKHHTCIKREI
jgi:hypothetical protein